MRVLVTGATGLIGCHAVDRLVASGHAVRAFVREPEKLDRVLEPFGLGRADVEVAIGDVTDGRSVESALADCDGVLHCAGLFSPRLADSERLEAVNVGGARVVVGSAARLGIRRIVFVSSMLALFPPRGSKMTAEDAVGRPRSMYAATKARAERMVRALQEQGAPITIVYPAACQAPDDPTLSTGPQLVVEAIRSGKTLVTQGGLAYTDARDLAELFVAIFAGRTTDSRLMAPSFFVTHEHYRELLERVSGRPLRSVRVPGPAMRAMGLLGDLAQRLGRDAQLTSEAAGVLTRSVPIDDRVARALLPGPARSAEASFRDLLEWLGRAGHLAFSPEACDSRDRRRS